MSDDPRPEWEQHIDEMVILTNVRPFTDDWVCCKFRIKELERKLAEATDQIERLRENKNGWRDRYITLKDKLLDALTESQKEST